MATLSRLPRRVVALWTSLLFAAMAVLGPSPVAADDTYGVFTTPERSGPTEFYSDNPVYEIGTTLQIKWNTGMRTYQLNMWQQWLNESVAVPTDVTIMQKAESAVEPKGTTWDVQLYNFDLSISNIFFFGITERGNLAAGFTSHYFNLTHDAVPTTTTTATSTPTSTPTDAPTGTAGPAPAASLSEEDADAGLRVGLGVGLGVGLPLVALCAFVAGFVYFRRKYKGGNSNNTNGNSSNSSSNNNGGGGGSAYEPMMQGYLGAGHSGYPGSESQFSSANVPAFSSYSPYGQDTYPPSRAYTPDMGPQQLDGTPKQPRQYFAAVAEAQSQSPPSELPGDSLASTKGSSYQQGM